MKDWVFPRSSVGKGSACNAEDRDSIPGSERSPGEGNSNPLQYSCLENPMGRGPWQAEVRGVTRVRHDLGTRPAPPKERPACVKASVHRSPLEEKGGVTLIKQQNNTFCTVQFYFLNLLF